MKESKGLNSISSDDLIYFNKFEDGYFPYSSKDLDVMVGDLYMLLKTVDKPKICEIGCGSGHFSNALSQKLLDFYPEFYGIDIAEKSLEHYSFNKICASAFNVPVEDGFFDVICFPASLHHLYPFNDAIKEMDRLLKPKGFVYFMEPNLFHPHRFLFMNFKWLYNKFKKINDTPVNPFKLNNALQNMNYETKIFKFVNIEFNEISLMQKIQNIISNSILSRLLKVFSMPWFIILAQKKN